MKAASSMSVTIRFDECGKGIESYNAKASAFLGTDAFEELNVALGEIGIDSVTYTISYQGSEPLIEMTVVKHTSLGKLKYENAFLGNEFPLFQEGLDLKHCVIHQIKNAFARQLDDLTRDLSKILKER